MLSTSSEVAGQTSTRTHPHLFTKRFHLLNRAAFCNDWNSITRRSAAVGANMAEIEIAILERNALSRRLEDEATLRRHTKCG